jgi:hypothetical protein
MEMRKLLLAAICAAFGLGVPSQAWAQNPPGVDPDHYQCYIPNGEFLLARPRRPILIDQFGESRPRIFTIDLLCVPVSKNGEPVQDERTHLMCYGGRNGAVVKERVRTRDQFGVLEFDIGEASLLCLPAVKRVVEARGANPPDVDPDHFQCYVPREEDVELAKIQRPILVDQFGRSRPAVRRVSLLCLPVSKNGDPVQDERTHLVCYLEENGAEVNERVRTRDQFGRLELDFGQAAFLCLPARKRVLAVP